MTRLSVLQFVARCLGLRLQIVEPVSLPVFDQAQWAATMADLERLGYGLIDDEDDEQVIH